jgi:hypothetical protein
MAVLVVLIGVSVLNAARRQSRLSASLFWILVWCAAGAAIIMPERTTELARLIGIDRGADLVSYCAILAGLAGFFFVFLRIRNIDRQITLLVRQIALLNGTPADGNDDSRKGGESDRNP